MNLSESNSCSFNIKFFKYCFVRTILILKSTNKNSFFKTNCFHSQKYNFYKLSINHFDPFELLLLLDDSFDLFLSFFILLSLLTLLLLVLGIFCTYGIISSSLVLIQTSICYRIETNWKSDLVFGDL